MDTVTTAIADIDFGVASPSAAMVPAVNQMTPPMPQEAALLSIIERAARDPNVDIDKMERLIAMQERIQSRQAQVDFDNAMSEAQAEMQPVRANANNPQTRSKYASYGALDEAIRPVYSSYGFSLSFNTSEAGRTDDLRVLCRVAHRNGHREEYRMDVPADGKGIKGNEAMTRTHAAGSAATYGKRYLLGLIFNIAVVKDDDGNMAGARGTAGAGTQFRAERNPGNAQTESLQVDPADAGIVQGDGRNQYQADKFKAAVAAGWKATNKTPRGKDDQILDYLDMAISPDNIARILNANEAHIETSARKDDIDQSAERLLRWFESQAASGKVAT